MCTCKEDVRILEVCLSPDLGGLELYMLRCARYFNARGVIARGSKLGEYFEKERLAHHKIGRKNPFALAKIIDTCKADVLHVHWTKDIPVVVLAKLLSCQKPKIVQTRHMHMTRFKSDFYHRFLYKNIDSIIAVTDLVKEQLEKFIPTEIRPKIIRSYIGVEKSDVLAQEEKQRLRDKFGVKDEFLVGIFGRIEEAKGQLIVLEAVKKAKESGFSVKTLVVGGCMDEEYCQDLKRDFKDDLFVGFVDNSKQLMQICDCVVLATKKETFGLVLIEAMSVGVAVLASNSGGPREIIEDGFSGLLFESMDSDDLYAKLKLLIGDVKTRERLALSGQKRAQEMFDGLKQFEEVGKILGEICE